MFLAFLKLEDHPDPEWSETSLPQQRGRVSSLYLIAILFNPFIHPLLNFFCSHALTLPISFANIRRIPKTKEVEIRFIEAQHESDGLIRRLVGLSAEEADVSFVQQEILDLLDHIEICVHNSEFKGTVMCLLDALSRICEAKNIKVLKGSKYDIRLCF